MKTNRILAAVLLTLALSLPGPARGDDLSESYYPLKEGLRWEYQVTSDKGATKNLTITNLAPREVNGKKVIPRKWEIAGNAWFELMEKDDNGIYRYADQSAENAPPVVITPKEWHLKFPVTPGASWNMATKIDNSTVNIGITVESVSDQVTVPAGTYKDCLKLRQSGEGEAGLAVIGYEWYAPKVGIVKSMVTIKKKNPAGTMSSENRTYQLQTFKP